MTVIDQRILIPISPNILWEYISNIENNPAWQYDCKHITLISTNRSGRGVRWRSQTNRKRELVIEITAWYEGLGYEYQIVDGVTYKQNRGRIRLQETPDGTIIQWTFNYELGGVLGGVRDALSTRRNIETEIVESLWQLWRNTNKMQETNFLAKSLMREAPDVEARAQYVPRHSSTLSDITYQDEASLPSLLEEPPITKDDTRPRPAVVEQTAEPITEPDTKEPDFLSNIPEQVPATGATPHIVQEGDSFQAPKEAEKSPEIPPPMDSDSLIKPALEVQQVQKIQPENTPIEDTHADTGPVIYEPVIDPTADTSQISVFDLFGVPKPSETQEIQGISSNKTRDEETVKQPDVTITPPATIEMQPPDPQGSLPEKESRPISTGTRIGIRLQLRRKLIKIRRP